MATRRWWRFAAWWEMLSGQVAIAVCTFGYSCSCTDAASTDPVCYADVFGDLTVSALDLLTLKVLGGVAPVLSAYATLRKDEFGTAARRVGGYGRVTLRGALDEARQLVNRNTRGQERD